MGTRFAIVMLSGLLALACDESSDSAGDGDSSSSQSTGGGSGTSAGSSTGGAAGSSAGSSAGGDGGTNGGTSSGGDGGTDGGTPSGGDGGASAGSPSGGAMSGGVGASGGASGAGTSGTGATSGCPSGGAQSGGAGGAGEPAAWTCVTVDDICECAHDSNGTLPPCDAELNCCMIYLARNECSTEERCFCQPATEEQCADAVERSEPIYMAVRSERCPP